MKFTILNNLLQKLKKKNSESQVSKEKETSQKDKYGNRIEIIKMNDGKSRKITQTGKTDDFIFLNDRYSFDILNMAQDVKVYWVNKRSERKLVKDMYGRLFHYSYDEEPNFGGDNDRVDILWTHVTDEQDSDKLAENNSGLSLLRNPFVANDGTNWMAAHEDIV